MVIAFDEAGNTGPDLLNEQQRIYALSSVNFTDEEADELINIFTTKSSELHFVKLRKKNDQQIIKFLNHDLISNSKIKYSLSEKRFALICRMVDYLIEPVYFALGVNLYQNGAHLAIANLIYIFSRTVNYEEKITKMLEFFQDMMRLKTDVSIKEFYDHIKSIKTGLLNNPAFHALYLSQAIIKSILEKLNKYSIDPAYPAIMSLANLWYYELNSKFEIIHDESKQVKYWKEQIEFFSNDSLLNKAELPTITGKKVTFPMQISAINLVDSKMNKKVQVADIIGSSLAYALNKVNMGDTDDFTKEILKSKINEFPDCHYLFPTLNTTPQSLGTENTNNDETLNHIISIIHENYDQFMDIDSRMD